MKTGKARAAIPANSGQFYRGNISQMPRRLTLAIRFLNVATLLASVSAVQAQIDPTEHERPSWEVTPVKVPEKADSTDVQQVARASIFNKPGFTPLDTPVLVVSGKVRGRTRGSFIRLRRLPPLPVSESSTVLIGTFESRTAYLSTDHTSIVSEVHIRVTQVLKDESKLTERGGLATLLIGGGQLEMSSGRILDDPIPAATDRIDIGGKYVFFLQPNIPTKAFALVKVWGLHADGGVFPCSPVDRFDISRGIWNVPATESSFVNEVASAIGMQ